MVLLPKWTLLPQTRRPRRTPPASGRWAVGLSFLVLGWLVSTPWALAAPTEQGPIPGYHAQFVFSPPLIAGSPPRFTFDGSDQVTITATLYDAEGDPLAYQAGAIPVRARLIFEVYDAPNATVLPISLAVDGLVSGAAQNVATFVVDHSSLVLHGNATQLVAHVISPNLYGFKSNGLFVGQGGNCKHVSSGGGAGIGNGIVCAESFYQEAADAAFATDPHLAATLDATGTPILLDALGGGGGGSSGGSAIASIDILNGDLSRTVSSADITYLVSAMFGNGTPALIDSAADVAWTISAPGGGSFALNVLSPGSIIGVYVLAATLISNGSISDSVQLTLVAGGSSGSGGSSGTGSGGTSSGPGDVGILAPPRPDLPPEVPPVLPPVPDSQSAPVVAPPPALSRLMPSLLAIIAAALFVGTSGLTNRGLLRAFPLRWMTVHEVLPAAAHDAWLEFSEAPGADVLGTAYLTRVDELPTGETVWAWQGYVRRRAQVLFQVRFHDAAGHPFLAGAAPVSVDVQLPGQGVPLHVEPSVPQPPQEVLIG